MPPRYAYWTILIDSLPTAFRAREQADLIPTFHQLKRANPRIEMKWFADGRVWDSPDQAADARERKRRSRDRPRQTPARRRAPRSNERRRR
jgi:hypothetical protein